MESCCAVIVMITIIYFTYVGISSSMEEERKHKEEIERKREEEEREREKRCRENNIIVQKYETMIKSAINHLWEFDKNIIIKNEVIKTFYGYRETESLLQKNMKYLEEAFNLELKKNDEDRLTSVYMHTDFIRNFLNERNSSLAKMNRSYMMEKDSYGVCRKDFETRIKQLSENVVYDTLGFYDKAFMNKDVDEIKNANTDLIASCVWFFAMEKPFRVEEFNWATRIYQKIHREYIVLEPFIAEMYATCQMGSMDLVKNKVVKYIKDCKIGGYVKNEIPKYSCKACGALYEGKYLPEICPVCHVQATGNFVLQNNDDVNMDSNSACVEADLQVLSSALMWMGAYEAEEIVLKFMFEKHIQMSSKMQERLHSLSNRKGDAPVDVELTEKEAEKTFDISALSWRDEDYIGFFDNLSFKDKILKYALAVREDDKAITLDHGYKFQLDAIDNFIKTELEEEYSSSVKSKKIDYTAISGTDEQKQMMKGILVEPIDYEYMAIFMYLIPIGKKLNIKFYTLFMPVVDNLEKQQQQVHSLIKKLNPNVTMWEDSLKETILLAIQKMLNTNEFNPSKGEKSQLDSGEIEF